MTNEIEPINGLLRLAVGSHAKGSGKGCAMNVVSFENGDNNITDFPDCADRFLARRVQSLNDSYCDHRDGDLLCARCSIDVLDVAHRTVGTNLAGVMTDDEIKRVYVRLAAMEARSVEHLAANPAKAKACVDAVFGWLDGTVSIREVQEKRAAAAYAAAYAAAAYAYAAAAYAYAAAAAAFTADYAAAAAFTADYAAAAYGAKGETRQRVLLSRTHQLIDNFEAITGIKAAAVPAEKTAEAVKQMCSVR